VEHLHLQIEFLRRLLLAENDRVGRLNGELHREKSQLEEAVREREAIKSVRAIDYTLSCILLFVKIFSFVVNFNLECVSLRFKNDY